MTFLRNSWYCAAWAPELTEKPLGRTMLGERIVLYRDRKGLPIALTGRCPHRFAPLEKGEIRDDDGITCPYHGLQFDRSGTCTLNPHGDGFIPPGTQLRSYPAVQKKNAIWVWMGDRAKADESLLPQEDEDRSAYATEYTYLNVGAHYEMVTDNLLDLTHAPFIHRNTLAAAGGPLPRHEFMIQGEIICSNYYIDASPPPPQMAGLVPDKLGRFTAKMAWRPASILELDLRQGPLEGEDWPALHLPSTHYLTPETERTTHYFASISRNLKVPDAAQDKVMLDFVVRAFTQEDEPMVRACQELMGTTDLFSLHPTILKTDIAAVQARRLLEKRRRAERSAAGDDETRA